MEDEKSMKCWWTAAQMMPKNYCCTSPWKLPIRENVPKLSFLEEYSAKSCETTIVPRQNLSHRFPPSN